MGDMLLNAVGARVRAIREGNQLSRRALAERSGLSERFLANLERGEGNISLKRFAQLAAALDTTCSALLASAESRARTVALLGVRGAGKSTIGEAVAHDLGRSFVELDQRIERAAGLSLAEIFELHGEAYYRRLEKEALATLLSDGVPRVVATGGSIVTHPDNWSMLASQTITVWLVASAEEHWERVVRQGDRRPMAENPHAFAELRALLAARAPLYARANVTLDTTGQEIGLLVESLTKSLRSLESAHAAE